MKQFKTEHIHSSVPNYKGRGWGRINAPGGELSRFHKTGFIKKGGDFYFLSHYLIKIE